METLLSLSVCHQQKHEFEVAMTCEGCSGAVTRVLNKLGGETETRIHFQTNCIIRNTEDTDKLATYLCMLA